MTTTTQTTTTTQATRFKAIDSTTGRVLAELDAPTRLAALRRARRLPNGDRWTIVVPVAATEQATAIARVQAVRELAAKDDTSTARFRVDTIRQSPVGRPVREPYRVVDTTTNETVDQYASKVAARLDASARNAADRAAAATPTTTPADPTVTISRAAALVAGWDDRCLVSDMTRTWTPRGVVLSADRATLSYAADVLGDYADPNDMGEGLTARDRRVARVASAKIRAALELGR